MGATPPLPAAHVVRPCFEAYTLKSRISCFDNSIMPREREVMIATYRRMRWFLGCLTVLAAGAAGLQADEPAAPANGKAAAAKEHQFVRLVRDARGDPLSLDTAIVHYVPKDAGREGLSIDLIGAVHVGEKSYYQKLSKQFESYDAMLFELVADKKVVPQPGQKSHSVISSIQTGMKEMLNLDFQLDDIDYTKKNFVHADMSPDEMAKSMTAKGETVWGIMFRMMAVGMAQQAGKDNSSDLDLLLALFDKDRAIQLKRYMAVQMEDMDGMMIALEGPKGSTLITERNKAALKVLGDEIKNGKKKIAIFYGAGHLGDMENRLIADFGMKAATANNGWKPGISPAGPERREGGPTACQ